LNDQGKHDEALDHYSIGLEITLKREGETADAAAFLVNIGAILRKQNKLDEAMEKYVSALRIHEKAKSDRASRRATRTSATCSWTRASRTRLSSTLARRWRS
jgi:tetratricopeptide (TPR) repeat protein